MVLSSLRYLVILLICVIDNNIGLDGNLSLDAPTSLTYCMSLLGTIKPSAFPDLFHFLWDPSRVPSCLAVSPSSIKAICHLVLPVKENKYLDEVMTSPHHRSDKPSVFTTHLQDHNE